MDSIFSSLVIFSIDNLGVIIATICLLGVVRWATHDWVENRESAKRWGITTDEAGRLRSAWERFPEGELVATRASVLRRGRSPQERDGMWADAIAELRLGSTAFFPRATDESAEESKE